MRTGASLMVAVLLVACGGGGSPTAPATQNNNPGSTNGSGGTNGSGSSSLPLTASVSFVTKVSDDGYGYSTTLNQFSPSDVSIARGGTVTWTNNTGVQHNITFTATSGAPANVADNATGVFSRTFNTAGSFDYHCTNHAGMAGTIRVQ